MSPSATTWFIFGRNHKHCVPEHVFVATSFFHIAVSRESRCAVATRVRDNGLVVAEQRCTFCTVGRCDLFFVFCFASQTNLSSMRSYSGQIAVPWVASYVGALSGFGGVCGTGRFQM